MELEAYVNEVRGGTVEPVSGDGQFARSAS
jgi:hypothetical protein